MKLLLLMFVIVFLVYFRKVKIKWKTFLLKGFHKSSKPYGVYCYCGKQGKGKTYSVIEFLLNNKDSKIYANINSIVGIDYIYFSGFDELLKLRNEHDCIIVYDEIFTALTKSSKMNIDVLDFLSQMRKRRIIFLTTAQEWLEINMTLRRYCRYQIDCNMISILGYPILIKQLKDAEQMKWSQVDNEYIAPLIETTISHGLKKVINSYDTFEQINNKNKDLVSVRRDIKSDETKSNNNENLEKNAVADTTTISNGMVNGQWTQTLHEVSEKNDKLDTSLQLDSSFWDDIDKDDIFE